MRLYFIVRDYVEFEVLYSKFPEEHDDAALWRPIAARILYRGSSSSSILVLPTLLNIQSRAAALELCFLVKSPPNEPLGSVTIVTTTSWKHRRLHLFLITIVLSWVFKRNTARVASINGEE